MQLYGDLARLFKHLIGYVGEMDRLAGKLVATGAEVDLRVRENLRQQRKDTRVERGALAAHPVRSPSATRSARSRVARDSSITLALS